jgi:hypothetical protein
MIVQWCLITFINCCNLATNTSKLYAKDQAWPDQDQATTLSCWMVEAAFQFLVLLLGKCVHILLQPTVNVYFVYVIRQVSEVALTRSHNVITSWHVSPFHSPSGMRIRLIILYITSSQSLLVSRYIRHAVSLDVEK